MPAEHQDLAAIGRLCHAVAELYRVDAGEPASMRILDQAVRALVAARPAPAPPRDLPVSGLLRAALELISPLAMRPLAVALKEALPQFRWRQNPSYTAENAGAEFMAGYGYVEFAGPKESLCHAQGIRIGLLVLGPGLHYPAHRHPAEEIYVPLTEGAWRRGAEEWRPVPPGVPIHHPSMIEHETKAGRTALLALYCWVGDTSTEARLVPGAAAIPGR